MSKHKASSSDKRNVAIVVKLLASDDDPNAAGLNCIFGDSRSKAITLTWTSTVAYHQEKVLAPIVCASHYRRQPTQTNLSSRSRFN